jgi:hypothetical protein
MTENFKNQIYYFDKNFLIKIIKINDLISKNIIFLNFKQI